MDSFKKSNSILDGGSSEFDESEHPRDEDGKFTNKGQTGVFKKSADLMDTSNSEGLTTEPKKHKIKGQKAKLLALKNKPDGTYDLETGEAVSYESGYQVSFQQTGDTYTDAEYDDKVVEMIKRTGSRAHGGVYAGVPEISFHTDNINEAMRIAVEYNQESVFDWAAARCGDWDNALIINTQYDAEKGNKIKRS